MWLVSEALPAQYARIGVPFGCLEVVLGEGEFRVRWSPPWAVRRWDAEYVRTGKYQERFFGETDGNWKRESAKHDWPLYAYTLRRMGAMEAVVIVQSPYAILLPLLLLFIPEGVRWEMRRRRGVIAASAPSG